MLFLSCCIFGIKRLLMCKPQRKVYELKDELRAESPVT